MLIRAHILPLAPETRALVARASRGDTITLPLLLESGEEENITVEVSAIDRSEKVTRIEGAATYNGKRPKVIAQVLHEPSLKSLSGYTELTFYP